MHAGLPVLMNRGWQEVWRSLDRMVLATTPEGREPPPLFSHLATQDLFAGEGPEGWDAERALESFRDDCGARFFAGATLPHTAPYLAGHAPEDRARTIAMADAICDLRFELLGHRALFFGDHIDWHTDPVSGHTAPLKHWSRIDPLDQESVGDSKVTWELNRHQWLVILGQAYGYTGEARYAEAFATQVRAWMEANRPGMGINWASSLEVSFRLIAWCWSLCLFRDSPVLTPVLFGEMLAWLRTHAAHVERYLSHYFSPNTHLTGEALGLFYAGVLFPELPDADHWRSTGARILDQQLARQVLPDGVYFEQSTCYQRYTLEIYLHYLILARRNGITVPSETAATLQRMLDFLLAVGRPDGTTPQIGDTDGGRLLPLVHRSPEDSRDVFALGAVCFGRGDYAWAAGEPAPEVAWLLGPAACESFRQLKAEPPARAPSRHFPDGGYAVMQGGWERDAHQLIFDTGPLGCPLSSGHGHADLLGIQCSVYGSAQIVDPGTYCYTAHPNWRDHFRGTYAHSTVTVDRRSQAVPMGPFSWNKRPVAVLRRWESTPEFDYADAEHAAYADLKDPVVHRRRVYFAKPHFWVLVDDLSGAEVHEVDLRFQFGGVRLAAGSDGWACSWRKDGKGLLLRSFSTQPMQVEVHEGGLDPIQGWTSSNYGLRQPAPVLSLSSVCRLPLRIVTLLLPADGSDAAPPEVQAEYTGNATQLQFAVGGRRIRVDDAVVHVDEV
jgi:hypothetical protein